MKGEGRGMVHDILLQVKVAATHFEYAVESDGVLRWVVGDKESRGWRLIAGGSACPERRLVTPGPPQEVSKQCVGPEDS